MSRPYAGMGVAAAGSVAASWATNLYASNLASLPGEAVTNLSSALSTLPSFIATHGPLPTADPLAQERGFAKASRSRDQDQAMAQAQTFVQLLDQAWARHQLGANGWDIEFGRQQGRRHPLSSKDWAQLHSATMILP